MAADSRLNRWTLNEFSQRYFDILAKRKELPAWGVKDEFVTLLRKENVFVVVGETGSGKTTQLPQFVLDELLLPRQTSKKRQRSSDDATEDSEQPEEAEGKVQLVACTQPRRIAAISVATRVAEELDVSLGDEVGYTIRFDDCSSGRTRLKYLTDGMLLREALIDPMLSRYACVMVDEAHERTIATDLLMGLLKELLAKREDLKVIIMSATLEHERFQRYFNNCPLMKIKGRMHPVEVFYTQAPEADYLEAAIRAAVLVHQKEEEGDILIFLTGQEEIEAAVSQIEHEVAALGETVGPVLVLPLYSALSPQQQQQIFRQAPAAPPGRRPGRKIICSTNLAETSLTVDGVVYVIDSGFSKEKVFNPRVRVESLMVSPISRASAQQRAGRAGRTRPGKCIRLYPETAFHESLIEQRYPEIQRSNLSAVCLQMLKLGIRDLVNFDYLDAPAPETLMRALEVLHYLGAIDDDAQLTPLGHRMAELPLDPELAKIILVAHEHESSASALALVAMLSVPNVFVRPPQFSRAADKARAQFVHPSGDHLTLLNVFTAFINNRKDKRWCQDNYLNWRSLTAAVSVRDQLNAASNRLGLPVVSTPITRSDFTKNLLRCVLAGFFMQVAFQERSGTYKTVKDEQLVALHPSSCLDRRPQWVVFFEIVLTKQTFLRVCSSIYPDWLVAIAPHYYAASEFPDGETKAAIERELQKVGRTAKPDTSTIPPPRSSPAAKDYKSKSKEKSKSGKSSKKSKKGREDKKKAR